MSVAPPPRLLDRVRAALRLRHFGWIRRFVLFHGKRHPVEMGPADITTFLSWLATEGRVTASTQNQALGALLFLYRVVLERDVPWLEELVRARRPTRLPVVLSADEVRRVLHEMRGTPRLMAVLLYGAGLRLLECARLRVKDVDFERRQIVIRSGKGDRDRVTVLPALAREALRTHLERVHRQWERDVERGAGWVELPGALTSKLPAAGRQWPWQWVSPRRASMWIGCRANVAGITCARRCCSERCPRRHGAPG